MKSKRVVYLCLFICALFIMILVNATKQKTKADKKGLSAGLPNPAAVYTVKLGYRYAIREGKEDTVIFPDGTACKGWDFFRGKAGQKWTYCEQHGGKIENRTENMGTWTAEHAVCVFADGSECAEADYIDARCAPGIYKKWSLEEKERIKFGDPF